MKFKIFYILFLWVLLVPVANNAQVSTPDNKLSVSTFQLENVDFNTDTVIELSGNWDFYWQQFIISDQVNSLNTFEKAKVPGFWKNEENKEYPPFGYASYKTKVVLPENYPLLALHLGDIHNSFKLFINGVLYHSVGKLGKSKEESVPRWMPALVILKNPGKEIEIVLEVANFRHRNGGIEHPIEIGNYATMIYEKDSVHLADIFLGGALLVLGMFFLGMHFFWKEDKASLYFGLFTFSLSIRVLIVGWRILIEVMPWLPWEVAIRLEYLALFFSVFFYLLFIRKAFPKQSHKLLEKVVRYFYYCMFALIVFFPVSVFSYSIFPNNFLILGLILYALYVYLKALKEKEFGAGWAVLSYVLFIVTVGMALIDYANLFHFNSIIISVGFISFVFSMSLIFASRFGRAFYLVEELKTSAERQNELILEKNEEISEQHNLIKDSIHYAKRIQQALLPELKQINEKLKDSFIYYLPQNVVSGDFYWFKCLKNSNEVILVIADCTGHGVPGAFMSIVGMNSLDKIISSSPGLTPAEILCELNEDILSKLNASDKQERLQDGMDIIVCKINPERKELTFSSALHKLVLVRDGKAKLYSGSRHFIGSELKEGFNFDEHHVSLEKDDEVFMFSDGIYDQKGGENLPAGKAGGKKLYYSRFEEILLQMASMDIDLQKDYLHNKIMDWKGDCEQLDDMLVFGWKVN